MRKTMLAIAAAVALGAATLSTGALAAPHGMGGPGGFGGGPRGGFSGGMSHPGGWGHPGGFAFHGRRFFGPGIGLYAYGGYPWWGYDGCWVRERVWTPYGWRWRLVDVCY
jgi:hypothetical protein